MDSRALLAMLLHPPVACIYCALAVTQSDIAWHTLMLILLSQSLLSYQHIPACICTPTRLHNVLHSSSNNIQDFLMTDVLCTAIVCFELLAALLLTLF